MNRSDFRQLLQDQILVIDGAMGTMIQAKGFGPEVYGGEVYQMLSDLLVFSRPDAIEDVHRQYFEAGAMAVETNSFGASPLRLAEFDLAGIDLTHFPQRADGIQINQLKLNDFSILMNQEAAQCACRALAVYRQSPGYDGRPLLVLGSIGPSNFVLSPTHADLRRGSFEQIQENFFIQCLGLIQGGVDVILFETQQDALELKAAVFGAKQAMQETGIELPIICQVTVDQHSRMQIFNTDILSALVTLQDLDIDAFGINCSIGPDLMGPTVDKLVAHSNIPISIIPNAGLPTSEAGRTLYKLTPEDMARMVLEFAKKGINITGGCCGTTPAHIQAIAQAVKGFKPVARQPQTGVWLSGPQEAVQLNSNEGLIKIGERLNVRGSKKVRDAVESGAGIDEAALEEVVQEQVRDLGLQILDVCMDSNQVDTVKTLSSVVHSQCVDFKGVFCIDSFDVAALGEAIKHYPGRPLINSISLEEWEPGVDKVEAVLKATKAHAPLYIGLTTGPEGPAVTVAQKVAMAKEIVAKAARQGVPANHILIDINAFPIGSESEEGMNFALESLNAISLIKAACPGVWTTIGIGNLTNGLASKPYMRQVLTSVFLDEGRKRGLDAAIINPNHYVPVESLPAEDYELGRVCVLHRDMDAFARLEEIAQAKKGGPAVQKTRFEDLAPLAAICAKIKEGHKERQSGVVEFHGQSYPYQDAIVKQVVEVLHQGMAPLTLVNDHLMKSMEELGEGFASGQVSLPHLLKAADVMKQVMGLLEAVMKAKGGADKSHKGVVVLGTVYQDVHSIGKDLAKTLLENYGFKVIDLGVQVPLQAFLDAAKEHDANAIGLSALLVQTSNHMITLSKMMEDQGLAHLPLLIGGAPVSWRHAAYVAQAGVEREALRDNVFYCPSAMDGVNLLNTWLDADRKPAFVAANAHKLSEALHRGKRMDAERADLLKRLPLREVSPCPSLSAMDHEIHEFRISLAEFKGHLDHKQLFSLNWKYGGQGSWAAKGITELDLEHRLAQLVLEIEEHAWFAPSMVFRVLPCTAEGEQVTLWDANGKALGQFNFNRVIGKGQKDQFSFAQFFAPQGLIGLQLTTAGPEVDQVIARIKGVDAEKALLLQGLADRVAEDLASYGQELMIKTLFGAAMAGLRCSPGYPAMSEIENNRLIFHALEADSRLQLHLTEAAEFEPTGSTGAVVSFHPEADFH